MLKLLALVLLTVSLEAQIFPVRAPRWFSSTTAPSGGCTSDADTDKIYIYRQASTTTDYRCRKTGASTWAWVDIATAAGAGDALTTNPLSQFAATTSAQLRGVLSDETGTGAAVFGTGPTINGMTGTGSIDLSGASATKPAQSGTSLPGTCAIGEVFFKTNATAGQNLYYCTGTDTWTQQLNSGGGATQFSDLTDCKVTVASAVATITAPCRVRSGDQVFAVLASATATLSGTSASGTVYFGWVPGASLPYASESTSATLTCNAYCTADTAGTFASGSIRIASAAFTSNVFGTVTEYRASAGRDIVESGDPAVTVSENGSTGVRSIALDTTSVLAKLSTVQSGAPLRCNSTTGSMTYTCSMTPALTGYTTGMVVEFGCATTALTGAATLNIDGLGAKSIKKSDGTTNPASGDCAVGQQVPLRYDGTVFRLPASGGGSASPLTTKGDVYTYSTADTRLAVGSDGQLFGADSAATTGNKWAYFRQSIPIPPCGGRGDPNSQTLYPGAGWTLTSSSRPGDCAQLGGGSGTLSPSTGGLVYSASTSQYAAYLWRSPPNWIAANGITLRLAALTAATSGTYKMSAKALCIASGNSQTPTSPTWGTEITGTVAAGVNSEELLPVITLSAANMGSCTAGRSVWILIGTPDTSNAQALYLYGAAIEYDVKAF